MMYYRGTLGDNHGRTADPYYCYDHSFSERNKEHMLVKLEQAGKVPSKDKFRRMICMTFLSTGCCPYNEKCVFLHDPFLRIDGVKTKPATRQGRQPNTNKDTYFWPDMDKEEVCEKVDALGLPCTNQHYTIPTYFRHQSRHDMAIYSLWNHFVEVCQDCRHHTTPMDNIQDIYSTENKYVPEGFSRLNVFQQLSHGQPVPAAPLDNHSSTTTTTTSTINKAKNNKHKVSNHVIPVKKTMGCSSNTVSVMDTLRKAYDIQKEPTYTYSLKSDFKPMSTRNDMSMTVPTCMSDLAACTSDNFERPSNKSLMTPNNMNKPSTTLHSSPVLNGFNLLSPTYNPYSINELKMDPTITTTTTITDPNSSMISSYASLNTLTTAETTISHRMNQAHHPHPHTHSLHTINHVYDSLFNSPLSPLIHSPIMNTHMNDNQVINDMNMNDITAPTPAINMVKNSMKLPDMSAFLSAITPITTTTTTINTTAAEAANAITTCTSDDHHQASHNLLFPPLTSTTTTTTNSNMLMTDAPHTTFINTPISTWMDYSPTSVTAIMDMDMDKTNHPFDSSATTTARSTRSTTPTYKSFFSSYTPMDIQINNDNNIDMKLSSMSDTLIHPIDICTNINNCNDDSDDKFCTDNICGTGTNTIMSADGSGVHNIESTHIYNIEDVNIKFSPISQPYNLSEDIYGVHCKEGDIVLDSIYDIHNIEDLLNSM